MDARINAKAEKALREALYSVTRIEEGEIPEGLAALGDQERAEVGGLAVIVAAYALIDACGSQWPVRNSLQQIAQTLATRSSNAERLHLDSEKIYEYLSRTVFGRERLEDVIPDEPEFTRLPLVVAGEALAVYAPKDMGKWDYLDQIEAGIEEASTLAARVLPAAVMRAYMQAPTE